MVSEDAVAVLVTYHVEEDGASILKRPYRQTTARGNYGYTRRKDLFVLSVIAPPPPTQEHGKTAHLTNI